ncbi:MAG TPA: metal-sulfur cluster assembly factor [Candidatus Dormibacteraeota bacterium]|jgi:metal-sulfur cluster biosynthetic enzyme|nr:metal-sulfur cluster assembly factor [Candidatus Dormibacteraeota bacterium]
MTETQSQEPGTSERPNLGAYNEPSTGGEAIVPDDVREALKAVVDPEIGLDIVNLGLIYNVDVHENNIKVEMTLTGPGCPVGPMLQSQVYGICAGWPGARNVQVDLVWSPPWDPRAMASEEAKDVLGIW